MPTIALLPQGAGRYSGWSSIVGATFAWQAIDDSTDGTNDGDDSYIILPRLSGGDAGMVSFPMFNQCEGIAPTSISLRVVAKRSGAAHPLIQVGFQRGGSAGFHATTIDAGAGYSATTLVFSTNPITAQAWTEDDLDGLEAMLMSEPFVLGSNRITLLNGSMTYRPPRAFAGLHPHAFV